MAASLLLSNQPKVPSSFANSQRLATCEAKKTSLEDGDLPKVTLGSLRFLRNFSEAVDFPSAGKYMGLKIFGHIKS